MEFLSFIRPDGGFGVRNYILVISGHPATNRLAQNIAGSVLHAVAVQAWPEKEKCADFFRDLVSNPNVAGAVVVGPEPGGVGEMVAEIMRGIGKPCELVSVSAAGGAINSSAVAIRAAMSMIREASTMRRQLSLSSRLLLGLIYREQAGAGELLYHCLDQLVENNARIILSRKVTDKKDKMQKLPAVKKLSSGKKADQSRGIYEIEYSEDIGETLSAMAASGVQLVLAVGCGRCPAGHTVMPVVNVTADSDYYQSMQDMVDLSLGGLDLGSYKAEDFSLLLLSEIIATASGKLTKAEILRF
ncbi:MAG: UxaA family hydrolase [Desulfocucumaceae bacterium]